MSYRGSRIDGGFHVTGTQVASAPGTSGVVLISSSFVSAGAGSDGYRTKGLTITLFKWNKGTATSIELRNEVDDSIILTKLTSNAVLDAPGLGSKNGQGIKAIIAGSGSSITMIAVPEKEAQRRIEL